MNGDLVQFLRERLDQDEHTARAAGDGWYGYDPEQSIAMVPVEDTQHIARHDPARVLAEVEAKRQILDEFEQADRYSRTTWGQSNADQSRARTLGKVLRLLALPYADHPDYREEWRP